MLCVKCTLLFHILDHRRDLGPTEIISLLRPTVADLFTNFRCYQLILHKVIESEWRNKTMLGKSSGRESESEIEFFGLNFY